MGTEPSKAIEARGIGTIPPLHGEEASPGDKGVTLTAAFTLLVQFLRGEEQGSQSNQIRRRPGRGKFR